MDKISERSARLSDDRGHVPPTKLAHVVRRTSRFTEMIRWYQTVFGAAIVHADEMLAFLTYDDEHHRFAIVAIPGLEEQPAMAAGTDHVAFTYADIGDLLYTYLRLKREGIEPHWCINHGPTTSMYYKDPDQNRIEFQIDNFPTPDVANDWIRSADFAANPIGVVFEPDELVARYRSGEPLSSLLARPPLPAGASPMDMLRL